MKSIGIIGSGIAGLQLALMLQRQGLEVTLYSDRTPDQIREGRLSSLVVRFDHTRERERALDVDHWDFPDFGVHGVHMHIGVEPAIVWKGALNRQASAVDMRLYQSTLLEDFSNRGGDVVVGNFQAADVSRLSEKHQLMVVAAGKAGLTELFPTDPEKSPYSQPQRLITGAFYKGLRIPDPISVLYNIAPGHGEIFLMPFTTFGGRVCSILIEAIPGGALAPIASMRYEDDPETFNATVLDLVRQHAPPIYELIDPDEFGINRPQDIVQGAITPTVRRGYTALGAGKYALALGDMHIVNDPVLGQGANTASKCAWVLGKALLENEVFDEDFCRRTEQKLWEAAQAVTEWTNMTLQPPPPHAVQLFIAAAQNRELANELADNFNQPEKNWEIFRSPEGAAAFLARHGAY
ncbi:styrene monooxygenase/indole monooxygenase family protein [Paraflavisolibacter sp. H34]|uniref:styrene monooxygenase/indole monooxygenase family protein n=1 Tax=Huijunlia imazamoxiresistens TaxID=3127457 RepID=UPI0030183A49